MSNGLISFHSEVLSSEVQAFPRTSHPYLPVVAPLWTAFRNQSQGKLLHRITTDAVQLSWVGEMIVRQNPDLSEYRPLVAAIATWQNFVLPNGATVSILKLLELVRTSFTDHLSSYCIFKWKGILCYFCLW